MFLDKNRQVVFCNATLLKKLGLRDPSSLLGKRPGEIFGCIHATDEKAGCGTSRFCRECGAVKAILHAQQGRQQTVEECRMTIRTEAGEDALDLRVWAVPVVIDREPFTIFTIKDIGDEKRRELLERTFFHDILNESAIVAGYLENARDGVLDMDRDLMGRVHSAAARMIDTIQGQRDLLYAEADKLELSRREFPVRRFLNELVRTLSDSKWAVKKTITLDGPDPDTTIMTDKHLLKRILINLIKNALEASQPGDEIHVEYRKKSGRNHFSVQNPGVMPESVKVQIFQRSFSTKGPGRGIGTYSVKLFTEKYLKGSVSFESETGKGTLFHVEI